MRSCVSATPFGRRWRRITVSPLTNWSRFTTASTSWSFARLEAMAWQCCPIAMSVGGVPEIIVDPSVGWLVQAGDRRGFFAAMKAAVQTGRAELSGLGARGRDFVVSNFDGRLQFAALAD